MDEREQAVSAAAEGQANGRAEFFNGVIDGRPAIKVAGVLVFTYVHGGVMRVSVDLDDAEEFWPEGRTVPLRITVQGETVFEAASGPEGVPPVPLVTVGERDAGQWFIYDRDGARGPYPSAEEAWEAAADGRCICDEDWERITGLLAECQDSCSLPLDHHGPCGPRKACDPQACELCGKPDRLTLFER